MSREVAATGSPDRSLEHLHARLDLLAARVRSAVERRRATDPDPDDRFRGLYLPDATVDQLLGGPRAPLWEPAADELSRAIEERADEWVAAGATLRLRRLGDTFGLDLLDLDILLTALAPDLDPRFERLFGYLHDDVTRRRASVGLALELDGVSPTSADGRARLSSAGALVSGGLIVIEDEERPLLTRSLRVPDRVAAHLLGDDAPEPAVGALLYEAPRAEQPRWPPLERAMEREVSPIYLREQAVSASGASAAAAAARHMGVEPLFVDLTWLAQAGDPSVAATAVVREARLRGSVLVVGPVEALLERSPTILPLLADARCRVSLTGARTWDPAWSRATPLVLDVPQPNLLMRASFWAEVLDGHAADPGLVGATIAFRLTPLQVARAAETARLHAEAHARPLLPGDVQAGARSQNAAGLDRLAYRVEPQAGWGDLVIPTDVRTQLRELAARARHRDRVLDEWGIGGRASRGRGITALFAGDSGTGKTLSAEVVAGELGLDLYVIDLSTVVDKYIGETEKNLDRIFAEADRVNGVLLFDEADALFGKRSEVRDARDRYANVEVAYLLQRMERFDGLAILTTNLRANLDEAFTRRIDVIVDFPMPEEVNRLALWRMHLPAALPQADDLDLEFMARRFKLSGGNIRNICLTAAFLAAEEDRPVSMADLVRGTEREYHKLGRLTVEAEFGEYFEQLGVGGARG